MVSRQNAFTLIELMVSLAVLAIVIGVATPAFISLINSNRIQSQATAIFNTLVMARSEAIKRNQRAVVCKSSDGVSCVTSGNWDQGWLIFMDADADNTLDGDEDIVSNFPALDAAITLRAGGNFSNRVSYMPSGVTNLGDTFRVCSGTDTGSALSVTVSSTGRPRRSEGAASCP